MPKFLDPVVLAPGDKLGKKPYLVTLSGDYSSKGGTTFLNFIIYMTTDEYSALPLYTPPGTLDNWKALVIALQAYIPQGPNYPINGNIITSDGSIYRPVYLSYRGSSDRTINTFDSSGAASASGTLSSSVVSNQYINISSIY